MKAIILAAGLGTRLRPITDTIPKVMLPVKGKPMLEHLISNLKEFGITEIGINLHYLPDMVTRHFGDGSKFGVNLYYSLEAEIQGTAGALNGFRDWIGKDDFIVIYGDNFFHLDYSDLIESFVQNAAAIATICLQHSKVIIGKGLVTLNGNNKITSFLEKPENPEKYHTDLINAGIYCFRNRLLDYIPKNTNSDFSYDIFPSLLDKDQTLMGYIIKEPLVDIGTPEAYNSINK